MPKRSWNLSQCFLFTPEFADFAKAHGVRKVAGAVDTLPIDVGPHVTQYVELPGLVGVHGLTVRRFQWTTGGVRGMAQVAEARLGGLKMGYWTIREAERDQRAIEFVEERFRALDLVK